MSSAATAVKSKANSFPTKNKKERKKERKKNSATSFCGRRPPNGKWRRRRRRKRRKNVKETRENKTKQKKTKRNQTKPKKKKPKTAPFPPATALGTGVRRRLHVGRKKRLQGSVFSCFVVFYLKINFTEFRRTHRRSFLFDFCFFLRFPTRYSACLSAWKWRNQNGRRGRHFVFLFAVQWSDTRTTKWERAGRLIPVVQTTYTHTHTHTHTHTVDNQEKMAKKIIINI